jgi:hypothetical protein
MDTNSICLMRGETEKNLERYVTFLRYVVTLVGLTPGEFNKERETIEIVEYPNAALGAIIGRLQIYKLRVLCLESNATGKLVALYHDVEQAISTMAKDVTKC